MSQFKRTLQWLGTRSLFLLALYFGLVQGVAGAANIAQFFIWFMFAFSWMSLSDEALRSARKHGLSVIPGWVNLLINLAVMALLLWYGWFWSASAYVISMLLLSRLRTAVATASTTPATP